MGASRFGQSDKVVTIFWATNRRAISRLEPMPVLRRADLKRSFTASSDSPFRTAMDLAVWPRPRRISNSRSAAFRRASVASKG